MSLGARAMRTLLANQDPSRTQDSTHLNQEDVKTVRAIPTPQNRHLSISRQRSSRIRTIHRDKTENTHSHPAPRDARTREPQTPCELLQLHTKSGRRQNRPRHTYPTKPTSAHHFEDSIARPAPI